MIPNSTTHLLGVEDGTNKILKWKIPSFYGRFGFSINRRENFLLWLNYNQNLNFYNAPEEISKLWTMRRDWQNIVEFFMSG